MADRELSIVCPNCGKVTKCDSCDCGYVPTEKDLLGATCIECGTKVVQRDNKNLYIALSKLQPEIEELVRKNEVNWRPNAQNETDKYLKEGLRDRTITRDLEWGIDVPVEGYDDSYSPDSNNYSYSPDSNNYSFLPDPDEDEKRKQKLLDNVRIISEAASQLGSSFQDLGSAFEIPELKYAGILL